MVPLACILNSLEMVSEAENVSRYISLYPTTGQAEVPGSPGAPPAKGLGDPSQT